MKKLSFFLTFVLSTTILFSQNIDPNFAPRILRASTGFSIIAKADNQLLVLSRGKGFVNNTEVSYVFRLDENGSVDTSFHYPLQLSNAPDQIELQKDGKIILGGNFTDPAGKYLGSLFRLMPNGAIDPLFRPLIKENLTITNLCILPNQKVFASGVSPKQDGTLGIFYNASLFSKDGQPDPNFRGFSFATDATGTTISVDELGVQSNNELIIAGTNLQIDTRVQNIYRVDSLGRVDTTFNPLLTGVSNFKVRNIGIFTNGTIGVLAGDENNVNIFDRDGKRIFAQYLPNSQSIIHPNGQDGFLVFGERVYDVKVNGTFAQIVGLGANSYVLGAANQSEDRVVLIGSFSQFGTDFKPGLVRLKTGTGTLPSIDQSFNAGLYSMGLISDLLVQKDGKLLVGGFFHLVNGTRVNHIARLLETGEFDSSFNPNLANINRQVNKIRQQSNGDLVIGANIRQAFDGQLNGMNITDKNGYNLRTLPFPYFGSGSGIQYLDVDAKDKIYAGEGIAYRINSFSGQELVRYNGNGSLEADYRQLHIDGLFRYNGLLVDPAQRLLIYGREIRYDGSDTTTIVRALPDGTRDQSFQAELDEKAVSLTAVTTDSNAIFVGGYIRSLNNSARPFLAKLDHSGKKVSDFTANILHSTSTFSEVSLIEALPDGHLMVHGFFDRYNDRPVLNSIIIDKNGNFVGDFLPELLDPGFAKLAKIDSKSYYLGGVFGAPNDASGLIKVGGVRTALHSPKPLSQVKRGKIFPNPSFKETIYLQLDSQTFGTDLNFHICELGTGRILVSGRIIAQAFTPLDINELPNGHYVLRLVAQNWEESHVFSKIR
ncbi:MAG: delta-60 repeat domain-containing protein [Haliscomenobacter sp.]|uniref:delta-60 repeat domain-containing protein n=1 Tax=Haliscomenobacter sp. TaxID=2717303 RepID=UPI0029A255AD|nr:delta-60 repeat domain-containing protein [Haliscomenobacter sp.]MDX2067894.1 delta-60 repeat domain-containing protein [Haliscomenobacter sp.]